MAKTKKEKIKKEKVASTKKKVAPKIKKIVAKTARPKPAAKLAKKPVLAKKVTKIIPPLAAPSLVVAPAKIVPKEEVKKIIKPQAKPVIKPAVKPEIKPEVKPPAALIKELKELSLRLPITLKDLAVQLQEKPSVLIKAFMDMKVMVGINQVLGEAQAALICEKFGFKIKEALGAEESLLSIHRQPDAAAELKSRPPIVTFMGHVDHGKTSLLDAIRKTKVVESEHGGITQHIGAYRVSLPKGEITFLDTPGHEAFTAMRARGARITDMVVLVVAADDGVMPQTQEAIDHARAAGVPIVVALNKIDKAQANIDRVKKQLSELNLLAEDWGGKTIVAGVSAKTGEGIDSLLEMILLEAEMLELKANPKKLASGIVIEAKMAKGRGPVSTLLIQNGTLRLNENIIVGKYYGKIRAMFDDHGRSVTAAGPACAVEVLGIANVPEAGERFFVIADEKLAKDLASRRQEKERQAQLVATKRISLEDLYSQIKEGKLKELKLIIKADVRGSLEAIKDLLNKTNVSEIKMEFIHEGVGDINASDVILAVASNALILGFNVNADERAQELIAKEGVDVRTYNIIYELANDIKQALEGMLEPKLKKVFCGRAEVRKVFKLTRAGTVAGCFVSKGKILRSNSVSLVRNGEVVFEGGISCLKRFKDDVRDVGEGFECGISLSGFDNFQEGDIIDAYEIQKIARKL
ncbi:MAG: translation initiation factor IF-2 [Candidatus Omnitrophica bacterium]|nr:translation initiation factor IF-2 [Candidatus Omnitrophota bacterium]